MQPQTVGWRWWHSGGSEQIGYPDMKAHPEGAEMAIIST